MDLRIFKYELRVTDRQILKLPIDRKILHVDNQRGSLCLWVLLDNDQPLISDCEIEIIGTGNPLPYDRWEVRNHIGSVIIDPFVWHVFEIKSAANPGFELFA